MSVEMNAASGAGYDASQTEMETITLNNRTITVPKESAAILKETESNLMSGYQAKLSKEREETKNKLRNDVKWYSTHDPSLWNDYDPTVYDGGKGYTGDVSQLTVKKTDSVPVTTVKPAVSFGDDMRVNKLEHELAETKQTVELLLNSDFNRGKEQVKQDRDALLIKYPYADITAVNDALGVFFRDNQRHPFKTEIETFIKRSNDFTAVKVANAQQGMIPKHTAAPPVQGTSPLIKKDKLPALGDTDGWVKLARDDLAAN